MLDITSKKIFAGAFMATLLSGVSVAYAAPVDPLNIAGHYQCTGFDSHDGPLQGDLVLTLDEDASQFDKSFGAYRLKLNVGTEAAPVTYTGYAVAQGQLLSIYFANDSAQALTDRGVGIAVITHDQDSLGQYTTTLHKYYYLPDYMRDSQDGYGPGGRGTEVCIKKPTH